ncbi:MAG: magnesium transporter [Magnetococcales bacterium]|nr:magnesium transporter [Magnetococcales bacterium]NGZ28334.1 magnesium transporter [Magnetococcales bacterium]
MMQDDAHLPPAHDQNQKQVLADAMVRLYRKQDYTPLQKIFAKTMPADLAMVLDGFPRQEMVNLFSVLQPPALAAKVLRELSPAAQITLLQKLDTVVLVPIVEKMPPDARSALLKQVPEKEANRLLATMNGDSRREVEALQGYDRGSAGGWMTSQFFILPEETLVAEALAAIHNMCGCEMVYYLFIKDGKGRLAGVTTLRQLVLRNPQQTLAAIAKQRVIHVHLHTPIREVASLARRHHLLAIPVVDEQDVMTGLVTMDDLMTVVEEENTADILCQAGIRTGEYPTPTLRETIHKRLPWLMATLAGGALVALLLNQQLAVLNNPFPLLLFLPVVLALAGRVAQQAATVATRGLRLGMIEYSPIVNRLREAGVALVMGGFFGGLLSLAGWGIFHDKPLAATLVMTMVVTLPLLTLLTANLPRFLQKTGGDARLASGPLALAVVDVITMMIYMVVAVFFYTR